MDKKIKSSNPLQKPLPHGGGILFVITAPSGAGKTSLCKALLERVPGLSFSVSHTTRPPRPKELEGVDYYFVDENAFFHMVKENRFIEYATVYGKRYGTSKDEVERAKREGADLLIEIDWQGARQIRAGFPDAVTVFIAPPSFETLKRRLIDRGTESPEEMEKRLAIAVDELKDYPNFDYAVVNDDFEIAAQRLEDIVWAERNKVKRQEKTLREIVSGAPQKKASKG